MSFISHRFFGSQASGRPFISGSRSCTPVVPTRSHIPMWIFSYLGAIAHTNPRFPHFPYSGAISHTNARSPIEPASSKKPDTNSAETSVSGPANQAPAGLHEFPAPTAGAVPHVQTGHRPAETSDRLTQTYASDRSTQIPRDGGPCAGDDGGPAFKPARRPAPAAQGVDPRGIWTGWIQQKSADVASGQSDPQDE